MDAHATPSDAGPWADLCRVAQRFVLMLDAATLIHSVTVLDARQGVRPAAASRRCMGERLAALLPAGHAESLVEAVHQSLASDLPVRCEALPVTAGEVWVCTLSPMLCTAGDARVCCLCEAVNSDALTAERSAATVTAQRLEEGMAYAHMGWFERDLATEMSIGSASLAQIYGLPNSTGPWHADDIRALMLPDDVEQHRRSVANGLLTTTNDTEARSVRYRIQRPDGEIRYLEVRYRNLVEHERPRASGFVLDVTETALAAQEFQGYRDWLELAVESAGIVLWERNLRTGALRTSPNWARFYGLSEPDTDWTFETFLAQLMPEDSTVLRDAQEALLSSGKPYAPMFRVRDAKGVIRQLRSAATLVRAEDGTPVRLVGCTWDTTAEASAEAARLLSDDRLSQIARLVPGMVFQFRQRADGQFDMPYASEGIRQIFGATPSEVQRSAQPVLAMIHRADLDEVQRQLQVSAETLQPWQQEFRLQGGEGPQRWVSGHANPSREADGAVVWHGHLVDVTHRRAEAQRLRESEARLNVALSAARMTFWQWELATDNFIRSRADGRRRPQGREASPMDRILELVHPDELAQLSETFADIAASGSRQSFTLEHRLKWSNTRESWVETRARGLFDDDGQLVAFSGVTIDISQRKAAERDRERLRVQLTQAQKMESIGMLTGGIAHDFNNILGSILGYAGLALQRFGNSSPPKLTEYLKEVVGAGERAREMVAQLLAFSRGESVEVHATRLGPIIEQSLKMLRPAMPSSINIQTRLAAELPEVLANPVQIQQVLVNLCVNARDATSGLGTISVGAERVNIAGAVCASCHQNFEGDYVALTVKDTGAGIAESERLRIFEPFFTTKAQGKGTGMGLAMVHGVVHRQGGHIQVDSMLGRGTTFRILVPVYTEAAAPAPSALPAASASAQVPDNAQILLVDDEPTVAGFMRELLEISGYRVAAYTEPQQACDAFLAAPDDYDLVVTDQTMPGLTGDQLASRLIARKPGLPIILVSGHSAVMDEDRAAALGIRAFLRKPLDHAALLNQIKAALPAGLGPA